MIETQPFPFNVYFWTYCPSVAQLLPEEPICVPVTGDSAHTNTAIYCSLQGVLYCRKTSTKVQVLFTDVEPGRNEETKESRDCMRERREKQMSEIVKKSSQ